MLLGQYNMQLRRSVPLDMTPFIKRSSFSHEREVRIQVDVWNQDEGVRVPVTVADLIDEVRVHPKSEQWEVDSIINVTKQYQFGFGVARSPMNAPK